MRNITNFNGIKGLTLVSIRTPKMRGKWGVTYTYTGITGARHMVRSTETFWTKDDVAEWAERLIVDATPDSECVSDTHRVPR